MADYNKSLDEMENVNPVSIDGFRRANQKVFCRAFQKTNTKCDVTINNIAETFNGYIINSRTKHMIYTLEDIIIALMQRLVVKRQEMEKTNVVLCPRIQAKLEKEKEEATNCFPMPSINMIFRVNHKMDCFIVDMVVKTYTCRKWDKCGMPCCHAFSCIFLSRKNVEDFVDDCYKREAYLRAYSSSIPPPLGLSNNLTLSLIRLDQAGKEKIREKIPMKTLIDLKD